jgi:hypothetical protein
MVELMRDLGGPIEQINPSKYLHTVIDNVLDRLMMEGTAKQSKPSNTITAKSNKTASGGKKK